MAAFEFSAVPLDARLLAASVADQSCGGYASFEGWVRDCNDGRAVARLEYEAYAALAVREGERILAEAVGRFGATHARCVHRIGPLGLGELAVWVGASAPHRAEAFAACRFIIDEVKHRVPIWKKEHYADGDSGWVNCERCAAPAAHGEGPEHAPHPDHGGNEPAGARHRPGAARPDYSRQMVLPEVGAAGQARIRAARVLVVGAGGLGAPVLSYLAGAGVGTLGILDGDVLDASNLHRQTLYTLDEIGRPKALLAAARLRAQNPEVDVRAHVERATHERLPALASAYDVLVDCSDNFATRFVVNDAAVSAGKPAVLASVYQFEGQLQVLKPGGACLRCVWPEAPADGVVGNCAVAGVLGPVAGALGSLQALEVLKLVLGLPSPAENAVVLVDLNTLATRHVRATRAAACTGRNCVRTLGRSAPEEIDVDVDAGLLEQASGLGYVVVDVRELTELVRTPLPVPSLHIPLDRLLDDPRQLGTGRRYLLVCARGSRSRAAALTLRGAGLRSVWSLRGGLAARRVPQP